MDTSGWYFAGSTRLGATAWNKNPNALDELILTDPENFKSGAAFCRKAINVGTCRKWRASFEYRINDGRSIADGMAFCFLANPPTGFVYGGGIGIPSYPQGLMIVLDTWANAICGTETVPKLEIAYGTGDANYTECPQGGVDQPVKGPLAVLRRPYYNEMEVTYDNGNIRVYINGGFILKGYYQTNYAGYFGFTASTGGSNDRHSVRNFKLYGPPPQTITLHADTLSNLSNLNWSPYDPCQAGSLKFYQIWRKLGNSTDSVLVGDTGPGQTFWQSPNASDGSRQCYRVHASEALDTNTGAWSNEVCLNFDYNIHPCNVFTPGTDAYNGTFFIKNLELYPNNEVEIYNRWGKQVYRKSGYANNWDAENLPGGLYFYTVSVAGIQLAKGGLTVIRP